MIKLELIALNVVKPEDFLGCTPEEVAEIRSSQRVNFLPGLYEEFLLKMGKGAGRFLENHKCFYPDLLHVQDELKEDILRDEMTTFKLPDDAFVFMVNQGYEFSYFHTNNQEYDPPVYHYIEGDGSTRDIKPIKQWDHLSDDFRYSLSIYRPKKSR